MKANYIFLFFVFSYIFFTCCGFDENFSESALSKRYLQLENITYGQYYANLNCHHGNCVPYGDPNCECDCDICYDDHDGSYCSYKQRSLIITFCVSFFGGCFGADWFYLARGNSGYIVAGVFKLCTLGGFGVWWLVDWIRVLAGTFPDGSGVSLC